MKKRIKEVIDSNGISKFYIQEKFILWWTPRRYPTFTSKEKAEEWMNYRPEYIVKFH
jgi:hypothetical protein